MIFVTVGMHHQPFDRLLQTMDEVARNSGEEVLMQRGCSTYVPQYARYFDFDTNQRLVELTREAQVIVCHAAVGTILLALLEGKPAVIVPRLKKFEEVFDDHQLQIAEALDIAGMAVAVYEPTPQNLEAAILKAKQLQYDNSRSTQLVRELEKQLDGWSASKGIKPPKA